MNNIDDKILDDISKELMCFRIDIKNNGNELNSISVISAEECKVTTPKWFQNESGIGTVIEGSSKKQFLKIRTIQDGTLILSFKGQDKRFEGKRFPLWTDYESIKIDGKEILSTPIFTWHDKPYKYQISVKDGQEVTIEFALKKHLYFSEELTDLLSKLFYDNRVIQDNITDIIHYIKRANSWSKIIAVTGYFHSGGSTVTGFLNEFDNTTVMEYCEKKYTAKITPSSGEVIFFTHTNFFNFIDAFYLNNPLEKDFIIKKFINDIYNCYDKKGAKPGEKNPEFYNDNFLNSLSSLLYSVLDLDEYTLNFMKDKRFPFKWNLADDKFQNCSFMRGKGISQYLFYQFKDISKEQFEHFIGVCLNSLFDSIQSKEYLVCDQMLKLNRKQYSLLDKLNSYLTDSPIKEICVYRDPRDRFLSAFRDDISFLSRDVDKYTASYANGLLEKHFSQPSPNRLMVRFEDMVLKYEETTKKIMDFIGMDPIHHVAPKSVFDPAISVVNIGAYKQFVDQDFMKQIEERMPEYCYYPEKENLSQEALDLLKGTEND